jgi:hypothetical protein
MLNYAVRIQGHTIDELNNTYYRLHITDLSLMDTREILVRFSTLLDIHNKLTQDNPYYDV